MLTVCPIPEVGQNPELAGTVATLKAGEVSPIIQVGPAKLAVAAVTNVEAPKPNSLAEVEDRIRESLINKKVGNTHRTTGTGNDRKAEGTQGQR